MFTYVIGGAIVAAVLVAIANYRRESKSNHDHNEISVANEDFDGTVGDKAEDQASLSTGLVTELTDDNWEALLLRSKSDLPIIIEFHTSWCPGCKAQAPIFARAASKYATRARFFSADCDDFDHLARVGDVKKIPSTFFIEPGSKTQIVRVGLVQLEEFGAELQQLAALAATGKPTEDENHPYLFD